MTAVSPTPAKSPHIQSRVTNGHLFLAPVDLRRRNGKRLKDLIAFFAGQVGGTYADLPEYPRQLVRQAATLQARIEEMELAMAKGDMSAPVSNYTSAIQTLDMIRRRIESLRKAVVKDGTAPLFTKTEVEEGLLRVAQAIKTGEADEGPDGQ